MKKEFNVDILSFKEITEIENVWEEADFRALLAMIDIGDDELVGLSVPELKDMCLMSLNDKEPHESAELVLTHIFKDEMTKGKIDQLSHEMVDDNLWEEHPNPAYHMRFFNAYDLLRQAYNGVFPEPTGVRFTIKIKANKNDSFEVFDRSLHAVIVRLLSEGLGEMAILNRLFDEQIAGEKFDSAENILWLLKALPADDSERQYEIISSQLWLGELKELGSFEADTHPDAENDDDDD